MERSKLLKCRSLIAYVRDSIDIPAYSNILPIGGTKSKEDFIIRKACSEFELNSLCNLLSSERDQIWTKEFFGLIELHELKFWTATIALATEVSTVNPAAVDGEEVVGGIIHVNIPQSNFIYIAALCVKPKFRGRKIGKQLFENFFNSIEDEQAIIFCDCPRMDKIHIYSTLFPAKGKTVYRIIGYTQNLLIASEKNMTEQRKAKETRLSTISKIYFIPNEVDIGRVTPFDQMVSGTLREDRLRKLLDLDGITGLASINQLGDISGYGLVTNRGRRKKPVIGPVYARTPFAAFQLTSSLCSVVDHFNQVIFYVTSDNQTMLNFLLQDAECEISNIFIQHYSKYCQQITDRTSNSMIYANSSYFLLPEC